MSSPIIGIGTDICDVERIAKLLDNYKDSFLSKNFADFEIEYCEQRANKAQHYAARFAAKEAMAKALGLGFVKGLSPKSFAVKNDENGKPIAILDKQAESIMQSLGATKIDISLSHLKDYAVAFVVISQ
ncbi:MAG: holo-ACP synthase [Opitutales bacterium]